MQNERTFVIRNRRVSVSGIRQQRDFDLKKGGGGGDEEGAEAYAISIIHHFIEGDIQPDTNAKTLIGGKWQLELDGPLEGPWNAHGEVRSSP